MTLSGRIIRVRILESQAKVTFTATHPPAYHTAEHSDESYLNLPPNVPITCSLSPSGWRVGTAILGTGDLFLRPSEAGSLRVEDKAFRGQIRLVPVGGGRFDVVNDVDIDDYLKSVVSRELYAGWGDEAYKAQAIAARTYALYEKYSARESRHWDVHADTRSQVYGGIEAETPKSGSAVDETAGIVLVYGPAGEERIFKAYFSSCCGGVSQSVTDAFNEPYIEPLGAHQVGTLCSVSPRFIWGPVVISKDELTRRLRLWGAARGRRERAIGTVHSLDIETRNAFGRPIRFAVTDAHGLRYTLMPEELRTAMNTDASGTLPSSFVENIINEPDRIRFLGGHGFGHGVGLCQWCAEARARAGMRHEDIVLAAYPAAKLMRAY